MGDLISREAAINAIQNTVEPFVIVVPGTTCAIGAGIKEADVIKALSALPSAQPESLTDKEQRIFLAAMARERDICKEVDAEHEYTREPYEDTLIHMCREIERKVKKALWTI